MPEDKAKKKKVSAFKDEVSASDEPTSKIDISQLKKKIEEMDFDEGEIIPKKLRAKCTKNTYGGYGLRLDKYIYVLDNDYRVEFKRPLVHKDDMEEDGQDEMDKTILFPGIDVTPPEPEEIKLEKGDLLPDHLRTQCEVDLSVGGGSRIEIGPYLYLLDHDFRVTARMRVTRTEG